MGPSRVVTAARVLVGTAFVVDLDLLMEMAAGAADAVVTVDGLRARWRRRRAFVGLCRVHGAFSGLVVVAATSEGLEAGLRLGRR